MSDEDDFMPGCDEEDFDFGYDEDASDDDMGPNDMDGENRYYTAKTLREDEPDSAGDEFQAVIDTEGDSEWAVKASKQLIKLRVAQRKPATAIGDALEQFVKVDLAANIGANYREVSFSNMLEHLFMAHAPELIYLHERILPIVKAGVSPKSRLLNRTLLNIARLYFENGNVSKAQEAINGIEMPSENELSMTWRIPFLLELYALQIQLAVALGTGQEDKFYNEAIQLQVQMVHPRVAGVIRECGGILAMRQAQWSAARSQLHKAFKNYDEAGHPNRFRALRYYAASSIIDDSGLNPFDTQETKAYHDSPELNGMAEIVDAYVAVDSRAFKIAVTNALPKLETDPILKEALPKIVASFGSQAMVKALKPFSRVTFKYLAEQLQTDEDSIRQTSVGLILDGQMANWRLDNRQGAIINNDSTKPLQASANSFPLPTRYREQEQAHEQEKMEKAILQGAGEKAPTPTSLDTIGVLAQLVKNVDKFRNGY